LKLNPCPKEEVSLSCLFIITVDLYNISVAHIIVYRHHRSNRLIFLRHEVDLMHRRTNISPSLNDVIHVALQWILGGALVGFAFLRSVVFCIMFWISLFVLLPLSFLPLYCIFELRLLVALLVSSSLSQLIW
jgi:hypothetical protein